MKKNILIVLITLFCVPIYAQDKVNTAAEVKDVTVYTNGAEVNNRVKVNLPKGSTTLFVQNVAKDLDLRSVQICGPDGITVLSVSVQ